MMNVLDLKNKINEHYIFFYYSKNSSNVISY